MSSKEGGMGGCSAKADRGWGVLFNRIKSGTFLKVLLRLVIKETAVQHLKKKKKKNGKFLFSPEIWQRSE